MATKEEILESIENMTVLEFKELLDDFKEKFDVTAAAPVVMGGAMPGGGGVAGGGGEEQSEFDVIIESAGGTKIQVIKICLLYTSPSPRDGLLSRMPSSA